MIISQTSFNSYSTYIRIEIADIEDLTQLR
jgi:hypothetical protein